MTRPERTIGLDIADLVGPHRKVITAGLVLTTAWTSLGALPPRIAMHDGFERPPLGEHWRPAMSIGGTVLNGSNSMPRFADPRISAGPVEIRPFVFRRS